uniref:Uncharacterized protein n=1 Tax=Graphocephala atropunctata TaxID=36148 RepID=A0A1B6KHK3_9HEMI
MTLPPRRTYRVLKLFPNNWFMLEDDSELSAMITPLKANTDNRACDHPNSNIPERRLNQQQQKFINTIFGCARKFARKHCYSNYNTLILNLSNLGFNIAP